MAPVTHPDWRDFDAVLFDLDGVLTPTATVHSAAWKETLDEVLDHLVGPDARPFDRDTDYRATVDGRPRYDGVAAFLASRDLELPWGDPTDPPGLETVSAIGNLKNDRVTEILGREGVDPYPGSITFLDQIEALGLRLGVVSSSANAAAVLAAAGLASRFPVLVDGVVAAELGLAGKPAPDPFLEAARRLGTEPERTVVFEDAVSGVEAGVAGGFGLVVGVDRHDDRAGLDSAGADLVVTDLGELVK